jgi:hypothetical protein
MRRRLAILRDLVAPRSTGRSRSPQSPERAATEEERTAAEMKRRLEESQRRLKRAAPPGD